MTHSEFENDLQSDPHFTAFQYVSGELSDAETELFESALSDSEPLQQALIDVTRQSLAVAAGATTSVEARQPVRSGLRMVGAIAGLAACLLVAVVAMQKQPPVGVNLSETTPDLSDEEIDSAMWTAWIDVEPETLATEEPAFEDTADLDVPEWMLTAVMLDEGDTL